MGELKSTLPNTRYFFSDTYGWFDRSHFNAGRPEQILTDLSKIASNGGGIVAIYQGVRDDMMGYTAIYRISPHLSAKDITAAALGIYLDWSIRFEDWQGQPPQGLVGPLTSFAVEDLPSQYLGFFAQAHDIPIEQLFACYLGPILGSEEGPPDFAIPDEITDDDSWAGITRVQNKSFTPLVESESGWQPVDWPQPLQMIPITSGPHTWRFLSEQTSYLGDEVTDSQVSTSPSKTYHLRYIK
jgi:hypothetical protein